MIPIMSSKRKSKTITTTKKPPFKLSPESTPNPSLPDDVLVTFLARVSKLYYPTLSLVSKSFRSLLASPELYKARSLLCRTESCLYVCLYIPPEANTRWFTLCRKPDRTLVHHTSKKQSSSGNILVPIPSSQYTPPHLSGHAAVGSNIYHIGGGYIRSSNVTVLDCRSHTWREVPSLKVGRMVFPSASVIDGKIYVAGGSIKGESESSESMKVFDTKTQVWDYVPIPYLEQYADWLTKSICIEGKLYLMIGNKVLAYDPEGGKWELVEQEMGKSWTRFSNCVIENVFYCYDLGVLTWYDIKVRLWKQVKGLRGLHHEFAGSRFVKLADYGGKMAVLWDKDECGSENKMIWCVVIALERHNSEEIWGKVEWCDAVLTVPLSTFFEYAVAATV
ncbi:Kelch repeat type 1 [Arabidopsis suecica]|uniref:Kelch repeat type 1 n=1 Tax=Arabidopsis suecica TaxID=45249 RepID=A0A8T2CJE9_ARASU|nr:Kelch repeat type 1 [Arabidopsis suecica]